MGRVILFVLLLSCTKERLHIEYVEIRDTVIVTQVDTVKIVENDTILVIIEPNENDSILIGELGTLRVLKIPEANKDQRP